LSAAASIAHISAAVPLVLAAKHILSADAFPGVSPMTEVSSGPAEKQAAGWVLPLFHEVRYSGANVKVRRSEFRCLACDDGSGAAEAITKSAENMGAQQLTRDLGFAKKYGITLGD